MSMINESGLQAFIAGADLAANVRVKRAASGTVVVADAADGDNWIGTTTEARVSGRQITIRLRTAPGTLWFTAASAIADDTALAAADGGKVDDIAGGGPPLGYRTNEAAGADGDMIECQRAGSTGFAGINPAVVALTSAQCSTAAASDLTTTEALANDLKAKYNALQVDFAALRTASINAGLIKAS